jgi:hypothetical protein
MLWLDKQQIMINWKPRPTPFWGFLSKTAKFPTTTSRFNSDGAGLACCGVYSFNHKVSASDDIASICL